MRDVKTFPFGPRRARVVDIDAAEGGAPPPLDPDDLYAFDVFDRIDRALCALLYNYVPMSGHPGGSISSGRFVSAIVFGAMDYDLSDPDRPDADVLSYAAGHKALGLYAMSALRNEIARIAAPSLLPRDERLQLRLEDLLGFRRNPTTGTPLFRARHAKALDGHPTPATPFVRLATGASGVGLAASIGLAVGAKDFYGSDAPRVHIVEGEGGLTPGRVSEALAAAGTSGLDNVVLHIDWNQSSIDSDRVCREGPAAGDYVQWDPAELAYLHDWNVVRVESGMDFPAVLGAQRAALAFANGQPTAIVYRTVKGWRYGIEGKASHGAGHGLCEPGFFRAVEDLTCLVAASLPTCEPGPKRCSGEDGDEVRERCFHAGLMMVREALERSGPVVERLARKLAAAKERLDRRARRPRDGAPRLETVYEIASTAEGGRPEELALEPGSVTTLRGELGRALGLYNRRSGGALFAASADLLGSTSASAMAGGFPPGYWNTSGRIGSRVLSTGGICEDAMSAILSGLSTFGRHIGVGFSYGAFLAPLGHIAARLHGIGALARRTAAGTPFPTMILVCAHAGLKTGEDGPTHADPQALQLFQDNFPPGAVITLTPWEPREIWTLLAAALAKRPAVIAVFVTRPAERVLDRERRGLAPAAAARSGLYRLRAARGTADGTVVLQESGVTYAFVEEALPLLLADGIDLDVYSVASAELFDLLPGEERDRIFPEAAARTAIGITGFTRPTLDRWIRSDLGRFATLHPFRSGRYPGSGAARTVLAEAGLDGVSQYEAIVRFVNESRAAWV